MEAVDRVEAGASGGEFGLFDLSSLPLAHDPKYLEILERHGVDHSSIPVPLQPRYTRARRWTEEDLEWAYESWESGNSFHSISATLNRNPQDIIFKLLDLCRERGVKFTEKGRNLGSASWTSEVETCARELFEAGLPGWKIALIFNVTFEHVEKRLYAARDDYGHEKKNPFGVCTDHKRQLNVAVAKRFLKGPERIFEGFAGQGIATAAYASLFPEAALVAVESDPETYAELQTRSQDLPSVATGNESARRALLQRVLEQPDETFDLVDLDPFVTCWDAIGPALEVTRAGGLLFVTFGGEYRRCFIGSNRKSLAKRYRMRLFDVDNATMLEEAPKYMLGEVAQQAMKLGFLLEPLVVVRYPMIVRAYLRLLRPKSARELIEGFDSMVKVGPEGSRFNIQIPKWREISAEDPIASFAESQASTRSHTPRKR